MFKVKLNLLQSRFANTRSKTASGFFAVQYECFNEAMETGLFLTMFTHFRPDEQSLGESFVAACVLERDWIRDDSVMVYGVKSQLIVIARDRTSVRPRDEIIRLASIPLLH